MRLKNHKVAVGRNTSLSCPELYPQNTFSDFPIPAKTAGSLALLKGKATIFISTVHVVRQTQSASHKNTGIHYN